MNLQLIAAKFAMKIAQHALVQLKYNAHHVMKDIIRHILDVLNAMTLARHALEQNSIIAILVMMDFILAKTKHA